MSDSDARYEDIMRRIAERRAQQAAAPKREARDDLAHILDDVDAWGKLEAIQRAKALRRLCWGPAVVGGITPAPWAGVVIWRRGSGYHDYKQIQLIGIWALTGDEDLPLLTVGAKMLSYSAQGYEAEAYHKLIRKHFNLYYRDDGSPPPPGSRRYTVRYELARRLAIRDALVGPLRSLLRDRGTRFAPPRDSLPFFMKNR